MFFISPGFSHRLRHDLETMIEAAGGQVDKLQRSLVDVRSKARKNPRKYIIIISMDDFEQFGHMFYYKASKPLSKSTKTFATIRTGRVLISGNL